MTALLLALPLAAATLFQPVPAETTFAVVTRKAGIASGLSHDHLVIAPPASTIATLNVDTAALELGHFAVTIKANALTIDEPADHQKWSKRLRELGAMDEDFKEIEAAERKEIRADMLGADQLDVVKFPEIAAEVLSLAKTTGKIGSVASTHTANVKFTIHGKSVTKSVPAIIKMNGDVLDVESLAQAQLTEFGIEPVSIMLGAIQVRDAFAIYVRFTAKNP